MDFYINSKFEISHYTVESDKVKRNVRLAVMADLHNCMSEDGGRWLLHQIDVEKPDCVITAGDMVDGVEGSDPMRAMKVIRLIHEHYPLIYCMGNHEKKIMDGRYLHRVRRRFIAGLKAADLKVLTNSYKFLGDTGIKVSCFDLPIYYYSRIGGTMGLSAWQIRQVLGELESDYFNVMVAHDPQFFEAYSDYGPELVLSGHMHGGVIRVPGRGGLISPKLKIFPDYDAGLFERKKSKMIVSRGLGMHTIHLRVNNPPELVIVDIKRQEQNGE